MQSLGCSHNFLTKLPRIQSGNIASLDCSHNLIDTLPIISPSAVQILNCGNNPLVALPILPVNMKRFYCDSLQWTSLPTLPPNLTDLECQGNQLSALPTLPGKLTHLNCANNLLTMLPALRDTITHLKCSNNNGIKCLPPIKRFEGANGEFDISATGITCLSNVIRHNGSIPAIDTMPLCDWYNSNGCDVFANIQGKVFNDNNADCVKQTAEGGIAGKMNLIKAGSVIESIFFNGTYSFVCSDGGYELQMDTTGLPFIFTCPSGGDTSLLINTQNSVHYGLDFGIKCKPDYSFDLYASTAWGGFFRTATEVEVSISAGELSNAYGVYCANGVSGSTSITIAGPAKYISPAPGALIPSSSSSNSVTWNIPDYGSVNPDSAFNIIIQVDTTAQAGQQICFTVSVTPTAGDNNPSNNVLTHCFTVRTSYDPNNKEVSPAGRIDSTQGWLTYTVNFQNTGNDTAIHIYIDDTLDTNLDMASFQLLAYSHPNVTQVLPGGVVKFNFPNIYLPDSNVNEPLSHGFVQYKVKVKDGLATGSGIRNKAYIYFDFNPPVETNEVFNLFCIPDTTDLIGYVCAGGEGYLFNDTLRVNTGFYSATYTLADGCDSVVNLSLTILPGIPVTQISDTICAGDFYSFNDTLLQMPENYTTAFQTAEGCDSVVELNLVLRPSLIYASALTLCHGGSILFNDTVRTTSGIYSLVYQDMYGCDSIFQLNLKVRPEASYHFYITICQGESYRFKDQDLNTTGIYIDTLRISTCDSFNILHLTVDTNELTIQQVAGDTLMATGLGSIRWIDCNSGLLVPNQTDSVFTTTTFGSFAAIFSYSNCVDTTECRTVGFTGLPKNENPEVVLFPNPARDQLMVQAYHFFPERLSIYDVNGRKVLEDSFHQPVSIHLLQPGCYYLEVKDSQVTVRKRFVKM